MDHERGGSLWWYGASAVVWLLERGLDLTGFQSIAFGVFCWLVAVVLIEVGLWFHFRGKLRTRVMITVGLTCSTLIAWAIWPPTGAALRSSEILLGFGLPRACGGNIDSEPILIYAEDYRVALVCGFDDPRTDRYNQVAITVTNGHRITGATFRVASLWSEEMEKVAIGTKRQWHRVILLPAGINSARIKTLADVEKLGGVIVHPSAGT